MQNVDLNARLVVRVSGVHLGFARRDRRVAIDHFREHAACRLDTEGERSYVEQDNVFNFAGQYACLNSCAQSNDFIWVNAFMRFFADQLLDRFLYGRNTSGAANENNLVDLACGQSRIAQRLASWSERALNESALPVLRI